LEGRTVVRSIDSAQSIIRIEQSKGRKDRNVMLPAKMLDLLRQLAGFGKQPLLDRL
jgi:integrase/recombinase XerD